MSWHELSYNVILILKRYVTPSFLSSMMPNSNIHGENRDSPNLTLFHLKHKYFKNSFFPFAIVDTILKIVLNLYVAKKMVLKQLISSFDTSLALMFKGKPSSTKSLVSTTRFWQKIKTALFILLLVKPKCRSPRLSVTLVMGTALSKKRFNASCFYARARKPKTKDYEIKIVNRNSKSVRIANSK